MADTSISEDDKLNITVDGVRPAETDAEPVKRSGKKLILFSIVGLFVVGGAAAGGFFHFFADSAETPVVADEPPVIETPSQVVYIDLDPIFIHVETDKGLLQNVVLELALEVEKNGAVETRIKQAMPLLYEAYLRTLTERPIPGAAQGDVEVAHVKNRLRAENLRLLGPGTVRDVILRNIWVIEG